MAQENQTETVSSAGVPASNDWWMYHADERHSGNAAGHSDISSTSVQKLVSRHVIQLGQAIISVPAIVQGSIYVGTRSGSSGGILYKMNLATGAIQGTFAVPFAGGGTWESGIGSTPAVVQGRVYFTSLDGKAYCIDAATMKQVWATDFRHPDPTHNQFLLVLDWATLQDAWPTTIGSDHVRRYNIPHQPMYANPDEVALSSPAVVNDVVFVTTNAAALYAFNVANGTLLWQASDLGTPPRGSQAFDIINIGPAIYGNAVVIGTGAGKVHIYTF